MFKRTFKVVYRPVKNNFLLLPERYFDLVSSYDHGCLKLEYNNAYLHFAAWAPNAGGVKEGEIGINARAAKEIGLHENDVLKCSLIADVDRMRQVHVTPVSAKDWEIIELSSEKISATVLDQTRVVNTSQILIVWINKSMQVALTVDRLKPNATYGRIDHNTEFIVSPNLYRGLPNNNNSNDNSNSNSDDAQSIKSLTNGLSNETTINSGSLSRSKTSAQMRRSIAFDTSSCNDENSSENDMKATRSPLARSNTMVVSSVSKKVSAARGKRKDRLKFLQKELRRENDRVFEFRVIASSWHADEAQMSTVYVNSTDLPQFMDLNGVYCLRTPEDLNHHVRVALKDYNDNDDDDDDDNDNAEDDDDTQGQVKKFRRNSIKNQQKKGNIKQCNGKPSSDSSPLSASSTRRLPTLHASIQVNANLMNLLQLKELTKITLRPKTMVMNFVEKLELFAHKKTHYKIVENAFKRYVIERSTKSGNAVLINQSEVIRLEDDLIVTVGILPEHFRYCIIDAQILKENKIYAADVVRKIPDCVDVRSVQADSPLNTAKDFIQTPECDQIVKRLVAELKINLCLDKENMVLRQGNILIAGHSGAGKTVLVERILDQLVRRPYYCFYDVFQCKRSKGRKTESIQKDLRNIFTASLANAPSVVVLENLDVLAHAAGDQSVQDGEYFNRIADTIVSIIVQYTSSNAIAVIATVNDMSSLNKRLCAPRGRHLFQSVIKLPDLERTDREIMINELCSHVQAAEKLDVKSLAHLTEGYNNGDLVQFVERAIFYAYRNNKANPILTSQNLETSLQNTNQYCLQGIENYQNNKNNSNNNKLNEEKAAVPVEELPGLESVVIVLEEVLLWPSRYPSIFGASPLRNQAGILLYGCPGTGKTFLVSKMAASWNLRMISVKGPELLAKYIGQSEENVRNIFQRARSAKPCLLFFDEFDSLAPKRGHDSTGVTDRVVNQLLTELDGVEGLQGVTVIAATSRPELLDPALLRSGRIDRLVECPLPNEDARLGVFELLSGTLNLDDAVDFTSLAKKTSNYTGADIQSILTSANMAAVKEALNEFGPERIPQRILVKQKHIFEAFTTTRPSLSASDVAKYQKTYARFTNKEHVSHDFVAKRATLA